MDKQDHEDASCPAADPTVSFAEAERAADLRARVFDLVGPTYILDSHDKFLDWNPAFEELIATPLKLVLNQRCREFARDSVSIRQRADRSVLANSGEIPQVVEDRMELELPEHGTVQFRKIVTQILGDRGSVVAWSVHLVVDDPEQAARFWSRIVQRLEQRTTWSKYATVYDELLLKFTDYVTLIEKVAMQVGGAQVCIDLGTGTGNSAIALLNADSTRDVYAVDLNEFMLNRLLRKASALHHGRLRVYQCDIHSMPFFENEKFDGATMVNTLYAIDDPAVCLREVYRILKRHGVLALTTPHSQTDVDRLFARLREDLMEKGLFASQEQAFHAARERHVAMDSMIHRFTVAEVRAMIESSGFAIDSTSREYVDAVVLIKARKR